MVNTYCCNIIVYSRARGLRLRVWNLNRNLLHRPRDFQLCFFHVSSSFHVVFVLLCFAFFTFCMEPAPIECAEPAPKSVGGKMLSIVRAATLPIIQFLFKPRNESELLLLFIEISNYASLAHLYRFCVEDFSCKITMRKIDWRFQWCATEKISLRLFTCTAHFFLPSICAIQRWRQRKTTWIALSLAHSYINIFFHENTGRWNSAPVLLKCPLQIFFRWMNLDFDRSWVFKAINIFSSLQIRQEKPYYVADPEVDSLVSIFLLLLPAPADVNNIHLMFFV